MISFQKRFLFVHIPKTGGNSIQTVLRDYSEDEIVDPGNLEWLWNSKHYMNYYKVSEFLINH